MATLVAQLVEVAEDLHGIARNLGHPDYQHVVLPSLGACKVSKVVPQRELQTLYSSRNLAVTATLLYLTFSPLFTVPPKISIDGTAYEVVYTRRTSVNMIAIVTPLVQDQGPSLFL